MSAVHAPVWFHAAVWVVAAVVVGGASACGPSHPSELTAAPLSACEDSFFFGNHVVVHGPVSGTKECAWLVLEDFGDGRTSKQLQAPAGWDVSHATLVPGDCKKVTGDARSAGNIKGTVAFHGALFPNTRNVELDVELTRGPLAEPASVFLSGSVDTASDLCSTP